MSDVQPQAPDALTSTLSTGRTLILLQLLTRVLTFALNQSLGRLASPQVFGTAAIQFDLVCSSILFLSREGVRNALLRRDPSIDKKKQQRQEDEGYGEGEVQRLAMIPVRFGLIVASIIGTLYLYTAPRETKEQYDFYPSLSLYVVSALVELAIEPYYIRTLRASPPRLHVRVQAEGGMAIVKAVVTVSSLVWFERRGQGRALLGFALGQFSGATWLAARYAWEYGGTSSLFWMKRSKGEKRFNPAALSLAIANTRQSFIKHVLTEADRIAVGYISPLSDQGGYAMAMNYGSLIARIVFQPLEETLLLHFSSSLSSPSTPQLLAFTIRLSAHLLVILPAFVPPLLPAILPVLLPRAYFATSAPQTLETYLKIYIPLMSLNGILEAFHTASATPDQVKTQAKWMMAGSTAFASSLWLFTSTSSTRHALGWTTEQYLVLSSCVGMAVRIVYAYRHARRFFKGRELRVAQITPTTRVTAAIVGSGIALRWLFMTERWTRSWRGWIELVGTGGALGLAVLALIGNTERDNFIKLRSSMKIKTG
ncbi:Rft protein-domain-containing protein [Naematelia encephala]|uniref:Man(5)GlcNAc(2)-PP-dolichol translocation protein RFT1 n=1 Tax=Naematelia encephala TaxID=71784 RepID=A0A1Y2BG29_9TREE|nr:Rft protein-domain-containing protein [Naematelia encephala]